MTQVCSETIYHEGGLKAENILKKTWILKGLILTLSICFIAFWGVIGVYADDYEDDPTIGIGKDVTVTYSPENDGGEISFSPDNVGYQCYRISREVIACSKSSFKVFAYAYHQGRGEELDSDHALSSSISVFK